MDVEGKTTQDAKAMTNKTTPRPIDELLPCPFCGAGANLVTVTPKPFTYMASCDICPAELGDCAPFKTMQEATQAWNTRHESAKTPVLCTGCGQRVKADGSCKCIATVTPAVGQANSDVERVARAIFRAVDCGADIRANEDNRWDWYEKHAKAAIAALAPQQIIEKRIGFTCERTKKRYEFSGTAELIVAFLDAKVSAPVVADIEPDLNTCPGCGGPADNGHDRCLPPNPYYCTKCTERQSAPQVGAGLIGELEAERNKGGENPAWNVAIERCISIASKYIKQEGWMLIESAPKDSKQILGYWERGKMFGAIHWDGETWIEHDGWVGDPDYWMPLPPQPTDAGRG